MVIECPHFDCKRKFTRNYRTDPRLPWQTKVISCPFCGKFFNLIINTPSKEKVSSRNPTKAMTRNQNRKNFTEGDYNTIFLLEIRQAGSEWGRTPKCFDSKEEAEEEAKRLKKHYPFLDGIRIVSQKK